MQYPYRFCSRCAQCFHHFAGLKIKNAVLARKYDWNEISPEFSFITERKIEVSGTAILSPVLYPNSSTRYRNFNKAFLNWIYFRRSWDWLQEFRILFKIVHRSYCHWWGLISGGSKESEIRYVLNLCDMGRLPQKWLLMPRKCFLI